MGSVNLDSRCFRRSKVYTDRKNQNSEVLSLEPICEFEMPAAAGYQQVFKGVFYMDASYYMTSQRDDKCT
ncbi:hypothetical protein STEG23_015992 [Scotinomys teguina]